jgi:transcriptional regulator with XRE-family HTH domain
MPAPTTHTTKKEILQLGKNLRAARQRARLTVVELSEQLQLSKTTITRLETGTSPSGFTDGVLDRIRTYVKDPSTRYDHGVRNRLQVSANVPAAPKKNGHSKLRMQRRMIDASGVAGSGLSLMFPWANLEDSVLLTLILDATTELFRRRQEAAEE